MSTELYLPFVSVTSRLVVPGLTLLKNHIAKISELVLPEPQPQRAAMMRSARLMPAITSRCKSFNSSSLTINLEEILEQAWLINGQDMTSLAFAISFDNSLAY